MKPHTIWSCTCGFYTLSKPYFIKHFILHLFHYNSHKFKQEIAIV